MRVLCKKLFIIIQATTFSNCGEPLKLLDTAVYQKWLMLAGRATPYWMVTILKDVNNGQSATKLLKGLSRQTSKLFGEGTQTVREGVLY
jgi:hypothetical protein